MGRTDETHTTAAAAQAGAFARMLGECQDPLFAYIRSLVRDFNDADDLFQQTALVLWRKFAEYDRSRSFLAWACGVARFEVTNFLRTRGRSRLYFSDGLNLLLIRAQDEDARDAVAEDRRAALSGCVGKLRERDRRLLEDCYGGGRRVPDVAEREGRSSQSVHNSLRRIRRALYECIGRTIARASHPAERLDPEVS